MDFWIRLKDMIFDNVSQVLWNYSPAWEKTFWINFFGCVLLSVLSVVLLLMIFSNISKVKPKHIFVFGVLWWISLFLIVYFNRHSEYMDISLFVWTAPVLWLCLKWILNSYHDFIKPSERKNF